jgi:hypothetical protein
MTILCRRKEVVMASLMFRAKADKRYYAETSRPNGAGTWYVFYYDLRGKKVRLRVGPNRKTAELAKGDWEPKDREARTIPLHGQLKAVLRDLKSGALPGFVREIRAQDWGGSLDSSRVRWLPLVLGSWR